MKNFINTLDKRTYKPIQKEYDPFYFYEDDDDTTPEIPEAMKQQQPAKKPYYQS